MTYEATMPVTSPDIVCAEVRTLHLIDRMSFAQIKRIPRFSKIPRGTLSSMVKHNYLPYKYYPDFDIPVMKPAPACASCGDVHTLGDICPQQQAVEVIVRVGEQPGPVQVKTVKPRKAGTRPRLHYKALYLAKVDELNALRRTYATMEE